MDLKFSGLYGLDDLRVARAALDGMVAEMARLEKDEDQDVGCECGDECPCKESVDQVQTVKLSLDTGLIEPRALREEIDTIPTYTKEQHKAAAQHHKELAGLVSKKGRKSAVEQQRINELTAEVFASVPGLAFSGSSVEDLAAALDATTTSVSSDELVEVRTLIGPPISYQLYTPEQTKAPEEVPQVTNSFEAMSDAELMKEVNSLADSKGDFFWYKAVVDAGGGNMNKLPRDLMLKVLADPDSFKSEIV